MSCYQLIYSSNLVGDGSAEILLDILKTSQSRNYDLQISGLLVFHQGRFMQLLEGNIENVKNVFASIQRDPRHTNVMIALETDHQQRCMPAWVMGFSMSGNVDPKLSNQSFYISVEATKSLCQLMPEHCGQQFLQFLGNDI